MDNEPERSIRLRHLLDAVQQLGALFGTGERQVDGEGAPLPGSALARVTMLLSMLYPAHPPRQQGRN